MAVCIILLIGCAPGLSSAADILVGEPSTKKKTNSKKPPWQAPKVLCPPVIAYSPDFLKSVEKEINSLPESSSLVTALSDYLALRDILRECRF